MNEKIEFEVEIGNVLVGYENLHRVALTGNYEDLNNQPEIPQLPDLAAVATSGDFDDLQNVPEYVSQATFDDLEQEIRDEISASQSWLPAVRTLDDLTPPLDATRTWLIRVNRENNVYQWAANDNQWRLYSENNDFVDELELLQAIEAHDDSADAHQNLMIVMPTEEEALNYSLQNLKTIVYFIEN